jgi:predicted nucleotidyltransferase
MNPARARTGFQLRAEAAVAGRFRRLLSDAAFRDTDLTAYRRHVAVVRARILKAFHVSKIDIIGSFARGSAIRQTSDVDLLFILRKAEALWGGTLVSSTTVLNRIRQDLCERFPFTALGRDGQAVVVEFADSRYSVDVVPAVFHALVEKTPVYLIPDGSGNWMMTSPQIHKRFIQVADLCSGGKLKNVVRLLKYWTACRATRLPLSSFHLELLLAASGICQGAKSLARCVTEALMLLEDRECRALQDPAKISGLIPAAATEAQRALLFRSVSYSAAHAEKALLAAQDGDTRSAIEQWSIVFNGCFPS